MITPPANLDQIVAQEVEKAVKLTKRRIIRRLAIAGEKAVRAARKVATKGGTSMAGYAPYTVQTGNLTSSIGYVVAMDGQIVQQSDFRTVQGGGEGSATGKAYARSLVRQYPRGFALILVAGMHYASYVQEIHHRDVLASATLLANQLVNKLAQDIDAQDTPSNTV